MASWIYHMGLPVYECAEYAMGCELFILNGRNREDAMNMIDKIVEALPSTKVLKVHHIGLRPDYPIPVARYFAECAVRDSANDGQYYWRELFWDVYRGKM